MNHREMPAGSTLNGRKVLIVEDELSLATVIELYVRQAGAATERAADGVRALELFRLFAPDVVVLDLGLPRLDGMQVLERIRAVATTPVLVLTARSEEVDEVAALELGGDDYLVKPVGAKRLLTRLAALVRRASAPEPSTRLTVGEIAIDTYSHRVLVADNEVLLTPTEFRLLLHLASSPGRVFDRAELIESAMPESDALERAVDIHLTHLRRKVREAGGGEPIKTVRGVGFKLDDGGA